ncbi:MAG: FAD-dependent oxidoreductase [Microthrixaceae bacterium]
MRPIDRRSVLRGAAATLPALWLASCAEREQAAGTDRSRTVPTPPSGTLITRWLADEWSRGSYSFLAVGASPEDRRALGRPEGPLVLAGEATSVEHPSTVHGALLSGRRAAAQVRERVPPGATVAVVGAGAAGLAAGAALRDTHRVVVFEARDRTGGRVWTDRSVGYPVELGAGWIHGPEGNPLTELAARAGVATVPMQWDSDRTVDRRGRVIDTTAAEERLDELLVDAATAAERSERDTPLGELLAAAADRAGLSARERDEVDRAAVRSIEGEFAADLGELSGWWWDEGEPFPGGDVLVVGGYDRILAPLGEGLDVRTGTPVRAVRWDDRGARVALDGDAVDAAAAVLTVPAPVLLAGVPALDPPLPAGWRDALGRLGVGVLDKVVLAWPTAFWGDEWVFGHSGAERGAFAEWVNLAAAAGHPAVVSFTAATAARRWEARTDEQIRDGALTALATIGGFSR